MGGARCFCFLASEVLGHCVNGCRCGEDVLEGYGDKEPGVHGSASNVNDGPALRGSGWTDDDGPAVHGSGWADDDGPAVHVAEGYGPG
jgi:hypothetical protein